MDCILKNEKNSIKNSFIVLEEKYTQTLLNFFPNTSNFYF